MNRTANDQTNESQRIHKCDNVEFSFHECFLDRSLSSSKRHSFSDCSFSLIDVVSAIRDDHMPSLVDTMTAGQDDRSYFDIEPTPLHEIDSLESSNSLLNGIEIDDPIFSGLDLATFMEETKVTSEQGAGFSSLVTEDESEDLDLDFLFEVEPVAPRKTPLKGIDQNILITKKTKKIAKKKCSQAKRKVSKSKSSKIFIPDVKQYVSICDTDVLHGRGAHGRSFPGNVRFHQEKDKRSEIYLKAGSVQKKMAIAQELVDAVHSYGGRFVEKDSNGWYIAHPRSARGKASQALRDTRLTPYERRIKRQTYRAV